MRRTILITVNSLFMLCAGLWLGATIGIGAMAAPAAFRNLQGMEREGVELAGYVVGDALERLNTFSMLLVVVMLAVAVFELFYRRRINTRKLLLGRALLVLAGGLVTMYLGNVLMPQMQQEMALKRMELFRDFHGQYRAWSMAQVAIGALAIVMTNAINIAPRRDGGHPRDTSAGQPPFARRSEDMP